MPKYKCLTFEQFIEQVSQKLGYSSKQKLIENEESIKTEVEKFLNTNSKDISSVANTAVKNIQNLELEKSIKRALISKINQIEKVVSSEQRKTLKV